jgi:ABC-2 type transport system ATP-binding protein
MSQASSAEQAPAGTARAALAGAAAEPGLDGSPVAAAGTGEQVQSPAIHTIGLRKEYRRTVALAGLSMSVARGEIFGFLGPNGAGKTTAVKLLLGLSRPTGGVAMVLGAPAGDIETRRRIGYLPELFRFQGWLTAREVLLLHCRLLEVAQGLRDRAVDEALSIVGLEDRGGDRVGGYSKGMQQRLGLGVALLGEPDLVVLDEPTSALDPIGRHDVREIIRRLRDRGAAVFLNTHLLEEVEHVCDRVAVIDKGQTIATGSLAELVGPGTNVRLRVDGLGDRWWRRLETERCFGRWSTEGEWVLVEGIDAATVPVLVREIVALGGEVAAVVPERKSLEDRFLELLRE